MFGFDEGVDDEYFINEIIGIDELPYKEFIKEKEDEKKRVGSLTLSQKIRDKICQDVQSIHDGNKIWRWDMDGSDSHIFKKLWWTFCSICKQDIMLLAKIKLIQEHVIVPATKRKILYFEHDDFKHIACTWDWFKLRTAKKRLGKSNTRRENNDEEIPF
jgi:hypothetical protein